MGELPPFLANLTNLVSLEAAYCGIRKLPRRLGKIRKLKRLDVSNNDLRTFSYWMKNLKDLEELKIHGNVIMKLPDFIGYFSSLRELQAGGAYNRNAYKRSRTLGEIGLLEERYYLKEFRFHWKTTLS
jgi:Leucine-rich repeat (LRR) protein